MKKRLFISLAVALILVATLSLPAIAVTEQQVTASVTVGETISITLAGSIAFGSLEVGASEAGASGQSDGVPAITITVEPETNVNIDIGIKGTITGGTLALSNWLYSTDFAKTDIAGLTDSYVGVYTDVGTGDEPFYHWITIPGGTVSGSHTISVSYKAVKTGTGF